MDGINYPINELGQERLTGYRDGALCLLKVLLPVIEESLTLRLAALPAEGSVPPSPALSP